MKSPCTRSVRNCNELDQDSVRPPVHPAEKGSPSGNHAVELFHGDALHLCVTGRPLAEPQVLADMLRGLPQHLCRRFDPCVRVKIHRQPRDAQGGFHLVMLAEDKGMYRLRFGEYSAIYARIEEAYLALCIGHHREVTVRPAPAIGHLNRCRSYLPSRRMEARLAYRRRSGRTTARKQIIKA